MTRGRSWLTAVAVCAAAACNAALVFGQPAESVFAAQLAGASCLSAERLDFSSNSGVPVSAPLVSASLDAPRAGMAGAVTIDEFRGECTDCACCGESIPRCSDCPPRGLYVLLGYEAFRGHPDGGWENNGLHTGVNFATRLGKLSDWTGIGMQVGGTMGVYDWSGTDYRLSNQDMAETQGFITYGLFRKANAQSRWSGAVVHDWMLNHTFSVFGEDPTLFQWRGQLGYAASDWNEIGIWGTWRGRGDTRDVPFFGSTTWRPIRQFNVYWHHKWSAGGADTWLWVGVPERERLAGDGSLGDYLAGALANCPLSDCVSLYSLVTYMHPSASPGPAAAREEAWSFVVGLSFFPARRARTSTVAGRCWMPQLPVATNGYFLVDASQTY